MTKCAAYRERAIQAAQTQFQLSGIIANRALDRRHADNRAAVNLPKLILREFVEQFAKPEFGQPYRQHRRE